MINRRTLGVLAAGALLAVLLSTAQATAQQTHFCNGLPATIVGTNGDDTIRGTDGRDVIVGLAGRDRIIGGRGHDVICGGTGPDKLAGGAGRDTVIGGGGSDRIAGGSAADIVMGGGGNDRLFGNGNDDTIVGGPGKDRLFGDVGTDDCSIDTDDFFSRDCEIGNHSVWTGTGDDVLVPDLDSSFVVARACVPFDGICVDHQEHYMARVLLDGPRSFDSLGFRVFDADGDEIHSHGDAGDVYEGLFLFKERPASITIDNGGGGAWSFTFFQPSGIVARTSTTSDSGNTVFRLASPPRGVSTVDATWNGFGNFAVIGVSPSRGRELALNEVRFATRDTPPFTAAGVVKSRTTLVQVISDEGTWTVDVSNTG